MIIVTNISNISNISKGKDKRYRHMLVLLYGSATVSRVAGVFCNHSIIRCLPLSADLFGVFEAPAKISGLTEYADYQGAVI